MRYKNVLQLGIVGAACALTLIAADFWKSKDSSQWTSEEVNKLLSDSPWAKEINVTPQGAGAGQRRSGSGRRSGGFGLPGGIGFPGGGGGYPGGGGGYPGGGGGYPRGGSYPSGGNGNPDDTGSYPGGGRQEPFNVTLRWESALPVQQALTRQGGLSADDSKTIANASPKDYVISIIGFRMPQPRYRRDDTDDRNSSDNDSSDRSSSSRDNSDRGNSDRNDNPDKDRLRTQFIDAAQLTPKGRHTIYPEDVQFEGPNGSGAIRFLFPRANGISAGDKEVDFVMEVRGMKIEHKFHLSDMQYQSQLAL